MRKKKEKRQTFLRGWDGLCWRLKITPAQRPLENITLSRWSGLEWPSSENSSLSESFRSTGKWWHHRPKPENNYPASPSLSLSGFTSGFTCCTSEVGSTEVLHEFQEVLPRRELSWTSCYKHKSKDSVEKGVLFCFYCNFGHRCFLKRLV